MPNFKNVNDNETFLVIFKQYATQISLQLDDFFLNSNFLSRLANNFQQILRLGFAFLKGEILVCLLLAYGIGTTLFVGRQSKIFFAQSKDCSCEKKEEEVENALTNK